MPSGFAVGVVDDLLFNRVVLVRMLRQLGFTDVFCFESGAQLLSSGAELHLVILDIVMPHPWDGYSTARAFRAREEQRGAAVRVPIVACSAEVDAGDGCGNQVAERCRLAGMDDCVAKPLSLGALALLLRKHTGVCGRADDGPERFRVSCSAGQAMQARAQRQLGEASRAACAAEDAAPQRRQSLDAACGQGWARLGALGASGLCDLDALSL